jgi:uncharacterized membrane protein
MGSDSDTPVDLYIASYASRAAAQADWDAIRRLVSDHVIRVDGLILVSRSMEGKIRVDDNAHEAGKGAAWGAVGGALVGVLFPPTLLVGALVGAGAGLGVGGLVSHEKKAEIKADVESVLPVGGSGIVAMFDTQWATNVEDALSNSSNLTRQQVDPDSAQQVKDAVKNNASPAAPT